MFDRIISGVIGAFIGAAAGYFVADKVLQKKYQKLEDEAVQSVREAFGKPRPKPETKEEAKQVEAAEKAIAKPSIDSYAKYAKAYISTDSVEENLNNINQAKEIGALKDEPYVIEPQEFGMMDYEMVNLTLYADGVLVDEDNRPLSQEDMEDMVGKDAVNHIGDYEEDAVHIRNDLKEMDYEILRDEQTWEAYLDAHPYLREE